MCGSIREKFFQILEVIFVADFKTAFRNKLKNCPKCGKIFTSTRGEPYCRSCMIEEQEFEVKIIQYVRDNPGVTIQEVMDAMNVPEKKMKQMIRDGLFQSINANIDFFYPCASCGRPIQHGVYCADCVSKLRKETKKFSEAMNIRVKESDLKKMSTIEKLDVMAEREFERENRIKITRNYR